MGKKEGEVDTSPFINQIKTMNTILRRQKYCFMLEIKNPRRNEGFFKHRVVKTYRCFSDWILDNRFVFGFSRDK